MHFFSKQELHPMASIAFNSMAHFRYKIDFVSILHECPDTKHKTTSFSICLFHSHNREAHQVVYIPLIKVQSMPCSMCTSERLNPQDTIRLKHGLSALLCNRPGYQRCAMKFQINEIPKLLKLIIRGNAKCLVDKYDNRKSCTHSKSLKSAVTLGAGNLIGNLYIQLTAFRIRFTSQPS